MANLARHARSEHYYFSRETYVVEAWHPSPFKPSSKIESNPSGTQFGVSLEIIADWAGEPRIQTCPLTAFSFLDIETTGLSTGSGTLAFLVGIAQHEGNQLKLSQFFLSDPGDEEAHLLAIEEKLASCEVLVTYNGKTFDAPLLASRFITHGWKNPLAGVAHLDLLHLARRLWRDRLPNRSLGNIEVDILGLPRSDSDVPGWMIPQLYFDYIHTGDARSLINVFYHNALDVVSLASLLDHVAHMLDNPLHGNVEQMLDLFAISRLYDDLNRWEEAIPLYRLVIERLDDEIHRQDAIRRLAQLHKHRGEWDAARDLWKLAATSQQLYAIEELAKYYEHSTRQVDEALHWTLTALDWLNTPACPASQRYQWLPEFQHRLERLKKKIMQL